MELPKEPQMLLSYVNTLLRDEFEDLFSLAAYYDEDPEKIERILATIDYRYDEARNAFVGIL